MSSHTVIKTDDSRMNILKPFVTVLQGNNKTNALKLKIIDTPLGSMVAVSDDQHLLALINIMSKNLERDLTHLTKTYAKLIIKDNTAVPLKSIESELAAYFKGKLTEFKTPFSFGSYGTEFQRSVWNEIFKIGYGKSSTYSQLANAIGKPNSYRAVANACGRNPIPIMVPCHRVLASGNGLGGYTGGTDKKIWLLEHERKHK